ncbi:MAG: hypothetical protein ACE5GO_08320 [Anaerolineales bacterium]
MTNERMRILEMIEVVMALGNAATPDAPLYVEVDEDDSGERVQVYIG